MSKYAEGTQVSTDRTIGQIKGEITRFGADSFTMFESHDKLGIEFECRGRKVRFVVTLPDRRDERFTTSHGGKRRRSDSQAYNAWEGECRRLYRSLHMVVKAKLAAIDDGVATFDQEFLPYLVMRDGMTLMEHVQPKLENGSMPLMLPAGAGGAA